MILEITIAFQIFAVLFVIRQKFMDGVTAKFILPFLSKVKLAETYSCDFCLGGVIVYFVESVKHYPFHEDDLFVFYNECLLTLGILFLLLKFSKYLEWSK